MLLVIDGNNIAYRAFHTPQGSLTTKDGEPTGVMYGVLHSLQVYLQKFPETKKIIVCWDGGKAKWRKDLYPDYKANRSYGDNPEEKAKFDGLFSQIDILNDFLPTLGVNSIKIRGQEADDLIAAICNLFAGPKIIVSSDKDMLQLISDEVSVYNLYRDVVVSPLNFYDQTGVTMEAYMGYRALLGDSSDNIAGVEGIGEKTAKSLMDKYGHIDHILNATGDDKKALLKSARTKKLFEPEVQKQLGLNHRIMNLRYVEYEPIKDDLLAAVMPQHEVDSKAVREFLIRWQMVSILTNYMPFIMPFRALSVSLDE